MNNTDEHPENICEICKRPNITWFVKNDLWNKFSEGHDIICPVCFIKQAEAAEFKPTSWELKPEQDIEEIKKEFYTKCEEFSKEHTYEVKKMSQEMFNEVLKISMQTCWIYFESML